MTHGPKCRLQWSHDDLCNDVGSDCKVFSSTLWCQMRTSAVARRSLQRCGKRLQGLFFNTLVRNCTLQCNHPLGSYNIIRGDCKLHCALVGLTAGLHTSSQHCTRAPLQTELRGRFRITYLTACSGAQWGTQASWSQATTSQARAQPCPSQTTEAGPEPRRV